MLFVFDTNVYDIVAEDREFHQSIGKALSSGRLMLLTTHIQEDELNAIPDSHRRATLLSLLDFADSVASGSFVIGTSRLGAARLSSNEDAEAFDSAMRNGPADIRGTNDALIIATARSLAPRWSARTSAAGHAQQGPT